MSPRRKYLRLDWSGQVGWRLLPRTEAEEQSLQFNHTKAHDIGLNGLSFLTDKPVGIGTQLQLRISHNGSSAPLDCLAEVVWVRPLPIAREKSSFSIGARFLDIPEETVHRLLMDIYRAVDHSLSSECARIVRCPPAQRVGCPAPRDGKNCWQYPRTACCSRDRSLCADCPVSLATLLLQM